MAGRRVDDHSRWLVDDDEVAILVDDSKGQGLGLRQRIDRLGQFERNLLSDFHRLVRFRVAAADADVSIPDQALDLRPGLIAEHRHEKPIEADAFTVFGDGEGLARHAAFFGFRFRSGTGASARRDR